MTFLNHRAYLIIVAIVACLIFHLPVYAQSAIPKDDEQIDFANGLFQRELFDMASDEYQRLITSFPESQYLDEAYFGVAESHFLLEDYKTAVADYGKYLELYPSGDKFHICTVRLGQSLFQLGFHSEALLNFVSVDPKNLTDDFCQILYFYMAKTYQAKDQPDRAVEFYEKTTQVKKTGEHAIHAFLEIGNIFAQTNKQKEAIDCYKNALEIAVSSRLKSLVLYKLGEINLSLENYSEASGYFKQIVETSPEDDISKQALGNYLLALFNQAQHEEVVEQFLKNKKIVEGSPYFFDVAYVAVSAYSQTGKYSYALGLLGKMLSIEGLSEDLRQKALLKKGEILIGTNRFEQTQTMIEENFKDSETISDQARFIEAETFYGMGQYEQAYSAYEKIVKEFSESSFVDDSLLGMAHAQNDLGNTQRAMDLFYMYYKDGQDKERRQEALYNSVLIGNNLGEYEKAISHCQDYLRDFKDGPRAKRVSFMLGKLYSQSKQQQKAIEIFEEFVSKNKDSRDLPEVYFLLAYNYQLIGRIDDALANYDCVSFSEESPAFYFSALKNSALIHLDRKEVELALPLFAKVIREYEKNDLNPKTYLWVAQQYQKEQKFDSSLDILQRAELREGDSETLIGISYFKAVAFQEQEDYEKAISSYDAVLSASEDTGYLGASRIGKGICLLKLGTAESALNEFNQAILEFSNDSTITMRARFEIANIEQKNEKFEKAAKLFMLIAVLYSDDYYTPESLLRAGNLFEQLDKKDEAAKAFEEIVKKHETSHVFDEAKKKTELLNAK